MLRNLIINKPIFANILALGGAGTTIASICGAVTPILGSIGAIIFVLIQWSKFKQQKMSEKITALQLEKLEKKIHKKHD